MGEIIVSYSGNGTAYITDPQPEPNQQVTLYSIADAGEELLDIIYQDSGGHSIALPVSDEVTFRYNSAWGTMFISVYFSGSTPPTPVTLPSWMIAVLSKRLIKKKRKRL